MFLKFDDFLYEIEQKNPHFSINYGDESLQNLRIHLLDLFTPMANGNVENEKNINSCISTLIYTLDKKLRIDSEIIDSLAKSVGMTNQEISKKISEEIDMYYGQRYNIYG